jgi:3-deoxy-D-manno-octulosonate 8-phosphate phosphatase (KDO 8-P phosphatase)
MGIGLFAFDVDGTLTDGRMLYTPAGIAQAFFARDGWALMELSRRGLPAAFVSVRDLESTRMRARDTGVEHLLLGRRDKLAALTDLCGFLGIPLADTLFMGDDLVDLPALRAAGLSACPSDAHPEVRSACAYVAAAGGGHGAVGEVIDMILSGRLP